MKIHDAAARKDVRRMSKAKTAAHLSHDMERHKQAMPQFAPDE